MTDTTRWDLLRRLRALGLCLHQELKDRLRAKGISPGDLHVLELLSRQPGLSAGVLGQALDLRRQGLQRMLASLEERGLLFDHFAFHDPRATAYSLTQAGHQRVEEGRQIASDLELQLLGQLGRRDGDALLRLLERTQRALHLARRMTLSTEVPEVALPERLADMYTENGFEPFPRPR